MNNNNKKARCKQTTGTKNQTRTIIENEFVGWSFGWKIFRVGRIDDISDIHSHTYTVLLLCVAFYPKPKRYDDNVFNYLDSKDPLIRNQKMKKQTITHNKSG